MIRLAVTCLGITVGFMGLCFLIATVTIRVIEATSPIVPDEAALCDSRGGVAVRQRQGYGVVCVRKEVVL